MSETKSEASEAVIELKDVHVRYKTRASSLFHKQYVDALAGVSFTVKRGQTLGIVGESGSGKSTSAKVLIGLEKPTSGQVIFAGEPVRSFTLRCASASAAFSRSSSKTPRPH